MIVKMNKYAFMVYHKEYETFLSDLRDAGVVHLVETKSTADNKELQESLIQRKRIDTLKRYFKTLLADQKDVQQAPARDISVKEGLRLVQKIEECQDKKALLESARQTLEKEIAYMEIWGEFTYSNINKLQRAGYHVTFFTCPTSKFNEDWVEKYNAIQISTYQSVVYFITITKIGEVIEIDAERPKMPDRGLAKLRARYNKQLEDIKAIGDRLKQYAVEDYNTLDMLDKKLHNQFNYSNAIVQATKEADDKLMLMEGWAPAENEEALEKLLDDKGFYYQKLEIKDEDNVPIQLKNNRFSRLFEPITKLFSLPNYNEFDPTPFFAPFFMMFFGFCFGDAGYGIIIVTACTLLKRKVAPEVRPFLSLFQFLGLATIIFGLLSGSFLGIALADVKALSSFKHYFLNTDNLMTLSIIVGLLQIVFGKCVAAAQVIYLKGWKYGIAPIGWIIVIVAALTIYGLPMLEIVLPPVALNVCNALMLAGLLVAMLYNSPGKNVFMNFGSGLWNAYNLASGLLGDTLSYIRLFAIGLTGAILGGVFNELAFTMTDGLNVVLRAVLVLLILLVGHSINFGLCMISSMVHPLRLTFVEYYKNAEFAGGGKSFNPFKLEK
ncbi:V-type ATP synthase subunit I [Macellibacteroides fermentans]|uniref:V/A-type H+-transporting ATPase subunit I n=1 Tax=Parabacteroides chartae TaxID=1037355 RepID=A0A1T5BPF8_9BACT|nr:V-type ATPase 116kDa subunit family protein [Parabacteroides chartae]SKB49025.1 V/A-type H+-transporting ATPase subunit I [Parabacteroides chartae]